VLAGSALGIFLVTELTVPVPFVELRLHANLPFTMSCLIGFLNTMEFRGTNFLMPVMLQHLFHYTPFRTGLFFLPPALVMGVTSILAGRLSDLVQPRLLLALGVLVLSVVSFQFCAIDAWATGALLLGLITLRRAAQALCQSLLTATALRGVPEDQIPMASGLFNLHRTLAGAVGVALTATVLEYREDVHTVLLSERQALYPLGTADATATIREVLTQEGQGQGGLAQLTTAVLHDQLAAAATLASYHDLFFLFAVLTLGSLLPVLCLRSGPRRTGRAGEAADQHAPPQPAQPPVRSAP